MRTNECCSAVKARRRLHHGNLPDDEHLVLLISRNSRRRSEALWKGVHLSMRTDSSDPVATERSSILDVIVYVAAALQGFFFLLFGYFTIVRQPFSDMLAWINNYLHLRTGDSVIAYLWTFHGEHHLVWIRALTALDVISFGATGTPLFVAAAIALFSATYIVVVEMRKSHIFGGDLGALGWLAPMLMFTTANVVDCTITINCQYPITLAFMLASLIMFDVETDHGGKTLFRRVLALICAASAGLASAAGLLVWPVLLWYSWCARAGALWLLAILVTALAYIALYFYGMSSGTGLLESVASINTTRMTKMADYFIMFLGLPISREPELAFVGRLIGSAVFVVGSWAVLHYTLTRRRINRLDRFAIALMLISLGSAVLAAVARVDIEPDVKVPIRYAVFVAPFHVALLCIALPRLALVAEGRWRRTVQRVGCGIAMLLVAQQIAVGRTAVRTAAGVRNTVERFYAGERGPNMRIVYPDLQQAEKIVVDMRRAGLWSR